MSPSIIEQMACAESPPCQDRSDACTAPQCHNGPINPSRDKAMAEEFLHLLDPGASKFTFQLFADHGASRPQVLHGTLDYAWKTIEILNTPEQGVGVFVTINETDFAGRKAENVVRARALFADADSTDQITTCEKEFAACKAPPSIVVNSGKGRHYYWLCDDIPLDQFSALQISLIHKLGTDAAVRDLPRVMRLPGTLHLKDKSNPRLVTLGETRPPHRWALTDVIAAFRLQPGEQSTEKRAARPSSSDFFCWDPMQRPSSLFAALTTESLAEGLYPDIEEIRSAAEAIPSSAIAAEAEWMKIARPFAHEAAVFPSMKEALWQVLDEISRRAPGYNADENRSRFERHIDEARGRSDPITIATLYHTARSHGWQGWAPPIGPTSPVAPAVVPSLRAVHVSKLPIVPPKRRWLHGTDLIRGAVSLLFAAGGRAKSIWLVVCALACASGRDLLNANVFGGPLRVLYLSAEDRLQEMALRIRAAQQHFGLTDADLPALHIAHWGVPLLQSDGNRAKLDPAGISALTVELQHWQPDVLIIDPLVNVLGGVSVNDNAAAALLMNYLAELADSRNMAIWVAHHVAKGRDPASQESAMGAASFVNLARVARSIEPLDPKRAPDLGVAPWDAGSIFRLVPAKQNYSAPSARDRWCRIVSVLMPNAEPPIYTSGDLVAVVEPFTPGVSTSAFPDQVLKDALSAIRDATPPLSSSGNAKQRRAAPVLAQAIARHRGGQPSEMEGKSLTDWLQKRGLIEAVDVTIHRSGRGSASRKGLALTEAGQKALQQLSDTSQLDSTPQSRNPPQSDCGSHAGGEPPGSPATPGGYGGNAGGAETAGDMPATTSSTE